MSKTVKSVLTFFCILLSNSAICQVIPVQNCNIVIGIANQDLTCTSGKQSMKFPNSLGYQYIYSGNDNVDEIKDYLKKTLIEKYKVSDKDITYYSSDKSVGVIIVYQRDIPAWKCSIIKYSVGFGSTESEAENEALKHKNTILPNVPYLKSDLIKCN